jgi:hypothetical protein
MSKLVRFFIEEKQDGVRNGNIWGPYTEAQAWRYLVKLTDHVSEYQSNKLTYHVRYVHDEIMLPYTGEKVTP